MEGGREREEGGRESWGQAGRTREGERKRGGRKGMGEREGWREGRSEVGRGRERDGGDTFTYILFISIILSNFNRRLAQAALRTMIKSMPPFPSSFLSRSSPADPSVTIYTFTFYLMVRAPIAAYMGCIRRHDFLLSLLASIFTYFPALSWIFLQLFQQSISSSFRHIQSSANVYRFYI